MLRRLPRLWKRTALRPYNVASFRPFNAQNDRPQFKSMSKNSFLRPSQALVEKNTIEMRVRALSSVRDNAPKEEVQDVDRKAAWLLKAFFGCTAMIAGYHIFPYIGGSLIDQSVSLLRVKDPLYKRMGASRLSRFAVNDKKRVRIVELGGATELVNMLQTAPDDKTRRLAMKAILSISKSDVAAKALYDAGALSVINSIAEPVGDDETVIYKIKILKRFDELKLGR